MIATLLAIKLVIMDPCFKVAARDIHIDNEEEKLLGTSILTMKRKSCSEHPYWQWRGKAARNIHIDNEEEKQLGTSILTMKRKTIKTESWRRLTSTCILSTIGGRFYFVQWLGANFVHAIALVYPSGTYFTLRHFRKSSLGMYSNLFQCQPDCMKLFLLFVDVLKENLQIESGVCCASAWLDAKLGFMCGSVGMIFLNLASTIVSYNFVTCLRKWFCSSFCKLASRHSLSISVWTRCLLSCGAPEFLHFFIASSLNFSILSISLSDRRLLFASKHHPPVAARTSVY